MKNLKEEISRIKKLFSEELLWGNLIKEQNPDINTDKRISPTEFATDTTIIANSGLTVDQAIDFVKANKLNVIPHASEKGTNVQNLCYNKTAMKTIYKAATMDPPTNTVLVANNIDQNNDIINNFDTSAGICYFYLQRRRTIADKMWGIKKINFWNDGTVDFYLKLYQPIILNDTDNAANTLVDFGAGLNALLVTNALTNAPVKVYYMKFEGTYDVSTHKYANLKLKGYYGRDGDDNPKIVKYYYKVLSDAIQLGSGGYSPRNTFNDPQSPRKYGDPGLHIEQILNTGGIPSVGDGKTLIDLLVTPHA